MSLVWFVQGLGWSPCLQLRLVPGLQCSAKQHLCTPLQRHGMPGVCMDNQTCQCLSWSPSLTHGWPVHVVCPHDTGMPLLMFS
jgi:hypothetical protein